MKEMIMTRIYPMMAAVLVMAAWSPGACSLADEPAKEPATLKGNTGVAKSVSWRPDGKALASASWANKVILWDVATGKERATLKGHTGYPGYVYGLSWSPDGKTLTSAGEDMTVKLWD